MPLTGRPLHFPRCWAPQKRSLPPTFGGVMTGGTVVNVAVTLWSALIVTTHAPVPLQSPLQPVKVEPEAGVAVSVTLAGDVYEAEQVPPQLIAAGALVTLPDPAPAFVTVSVW